MNQVTSVFLANSGVAPEAGSIQQMLNLIVHASPIVKGVIGLLVLYIIVTVFVISYKSVQLARAKKQSSKFLHIFWSSKRLDEIYKASDQFDRSPVSKLFKAGYIELSKLKTGKSSSAPKKATEAENEISIDGIGNVERAIRRATTEEVTHLEALIPILATIATTGPFIGLFGTVIGIMISFMGISASGSAGMDVVSQGVSEALITTAIGLMAAIPAVMAYNFFLRKLQLLSSQMENFSADFLNIVKRHFFS